MTGRIWLGSLAAVAVLAALSFAIGEQDAVPAATRIPGAASAPTLPVSGADAVPREVLAARTVDRILLFRTGNVASSIALSEDEVSALLTESLPGLLPAGVVNVEVSLDSDQIVLQADIVVDLWTGASRLNPVLVALPDTLRTEIDGRFSRVGRRLILTVTGARAQSLSLPASLVEALIRELPMSIDGQEGPALQVALPDGIADVRLEGGRLILRAAEPILKRTVDGGADG